MATIRTIKNKTCESYQLRFMHHEKRVSITFDSTYSYEEVELAKRMIESVQVAERHDETPDRATRAYFENAPIELQQKFSRCGISLARSCETLENAWKSFSAEKYATTAPSTQLIWKAVGDRLFNLFEKRRPMRAITVTEAVESRKKLADVYAEATVATTIGRFRTFWNWAVTRKIVEENVFLGVKKGSDVNRRKDFQIPREWTQRILDACPSQNWRTLFVLWRIGGLRQQEPLLLTWDCVNWEHKRLLVPSPKTSRFEGRENRLIPLFPELERELSASFEQAPEGEPYVVWANRRQNFDSGFKRILFWAGLSPWQKLFQNMRSSAENDLIEAGYPDHVVGAWIGHTTRVQSRHYLRVLASYYDLATANATGTAGNAVSVPKIPLIGVKMR